MKLTMRASTKYKCLFIAMPSRRRSDGTFADVAHPINQETRELICTAVIEVYNNSDPEVV